MKRKEVKRTGFTLVELLVVISIIAILLAILMPSLNKAKSLAKRIVCASHERSIFYSMVAYAQTYNNCFFPTRNGEFWTYTTADKADIPLPPNCKEGSGVDAVEAYWGLAYVSYGAKKELFKCPAKRVNGGTLTPGRVETELRKRSRDYSDYSINGFVCWKDRSKTAFDEGAWPTTWENAGFPIDSAPTRKLTDFKTPASTIVLHDGYEAAMDFNRLSSYQGDSYHWPRTSNGEFASGIENLWQWKNNERNNSVRYQGCVKEYWRHAGYGNILWLDGHTKPLKETTGKDVPCGWYTGGVVKEFKN